VIKKGKNKGKLDYQKALYEAGLLDNGLSSPSKVPAADYKIVYKSIIQARQEMPLVHQALERHMRGEEGPYTLDDNYADITLGGKIPAYYLQDVPVCKNCFQVYSIVDKARAKALAQRVNGSRHQKKRRKLTEKGEEEVSLGTEFESKEDIEDFLTSNLTSHQKSALQSLNLGRKRIYSPSQSTISSVKEPDSVTEENKRNLQEAMKAIEGLTKLDVAEIRTMIKPPAAVEVVIEAVMILLTGKRMPFKDSYKLLSGGEAFLVMLKEFKIDDVSDEKLRLVEAYVDNPLFRPENVAPVSHCASKFCAWVHGIVHAARFKRGKTHHRIDPMSSITKSAAMKPEPPDNKGVYLKPLNQIKPPPPAISALQQQARAKIGTPEEELSFVQKLERMKADKFRERPKISREEPLGPIGSQKGLKSTKKLDPGYKSLDQVDSISELPQSYKDSHKSERSVMSRSLSKFDPRPAPSFEPSMENTQESEDETKSKKKISKRNKKAIEAMQKKATERLSAQTAIEGGAGLVGKAKEIRCADGITRMPYVVMGKFSLMVDRCNFVVFHDFFDTYDGTSIFFKPIVQRHEEGCQILCFNYPGQAHTVWPRPTPAEREHGATEPILNNDWIADRIHELLSFAEESGDFLVSRPFHIVGIGNGACIAAAFCQKYANNDFYRDSLRSVVAINGFLYPDSQLSSILHAAHQVFESTPLNRPDIAVSYWSRFVFSEDYLARINPNLALNILTAVSNPITNDGRVKITRGCLAHKDYRGGLSPDINARPLVNNNPNDPNRRNIEPFAAKFQPIQVPVIVLQSTENILVNASNVDSFLIGRTSKHLWSHMLNVPSEAMKSQAFDVNAQWVGKMSTSPETYAKFSTLGKQGIRMLLDALRTPRGAFVMWARAGHIIQQEYKAAVLDLIDILACPTDDYVGMNTQAATTPSITGVQVIEDSPVKEKPSKNTKKPEQPAPELILTLQPAGSISTEISTSPTISPVKPSLSTITDEQNLDEAIDDIIRSVTIKPKQPQEEDELKQIEIVPSEPQQQLVVSQPSSPVARQSLLTPAEIELTKQKDPEELEEYWNTAEISQHKQKPPALTNPSTSSSNMADSPIKRDGVMDRTLIADRKQKSNNEWISTVPDLDAALALEEELKRKQQEYQELEEKLRKLKSSAQQQQQQQQQEGSPQKLTKQSKNLEKKIQEDEKLLSKLSDELDKRQKERIFSERQRRLEMQEVEQKLVTEGLVEPYQGPEVPIIRPASPSSIPLNEEIRQEEGEEQQEEEVPPSATVIVAPIQEVPPMHYEEPRELPKIFTEGRDIVSKLDQMLIDEEEARKRGELTVEEFEAIKRKMAERQLERDQMLRALSLEELEELKEECSIQIERIVRGFNSRVRVKKLIAARNLQREKERVSVHIQRVIRGFLGRRKYKRIRHIYLTNMKGFYSATQIQRIYRGYADRAYFRRLMRWHSAMKIQRVFRGHLGRLAVRKERNRLKMLQKKHYSAAKIQSIWRMKVAKEEYRNLRIHILAAIEIQRIYRGYLGRKRMKRRRQWETTKPGPERIKLGLQFIEESKQAFERQQEEIDSLHRAQERAESRISQIHSELKESEKELTILERELQEIDQIERDLQILTHERNLLNQGIEDAAGMQRTAKRGHKEIVVGKESTNDNDPMLDRRRRAEAYALEMTIQLKRSEREKKRQELEIEFANVFQEVEKKKKALNRLEVSLADMEATRERKDREFQRLQKNLMQLLLEQKQELDELREKGLELETATATTAAAAVATAQKAKEHEKRSHQLFSQTEELMKFQFMSMSLSYFSSLNMLKSLRDMNADTTSAAISLSAEASSTAASAAAAANLPSVKKLTLGADDYIEASIRKKKEELALAEKAKKEFQKVASTPLPDNVRTWTVTDVSRWLDTLSLSQYVDAFVEGSVDGPFLMELREEDLIQVLGIKHRLHVRKILLSREKLKPLSQQEKSLKEAVEREVRPIPMIISLLLLISHLVLLLFLFLPRRIKRMLTVKRWASLPWTQSSPRLVMDVSSEWKNRSIWDSPSMPRTRKETLSCWWPRKTPTRSSWRCCCSVGRTSITRMLWEILLFTLL
jgi:pimeloyl-ACP methyl ester carboxylesterase